jgi:hypothetical protein
MQEQVNEKTIALQVKATKLTATELKKVIAMYLRYRKQKRLLNKGNTPKNSGKKTTLEKLTKKYDGLKSIEITENNIKDFEKVAKKFNLEYALKKDVTTSPPTFFVFFKGKDLDIIDFSFKEYLKTSLNQSNEKRPSVRQALKKLLEVAKSFNKDKVKNKDKEQSL